MAWGWTVDNIRLFTECETYYGKLVLASDLIAEADSIQLLEQQKKLIDHQQAIIEDSQRTLAAAAVQRRAPAPRNSARFDPLTKPVVVHE